MSELPSLLPVRYAIRFPDPVVPPLRRGAPPPPDSAQLIRFPGVQRAGHAARAAMLLLLLGSVSPADAWPPARAASITALGDLPGGNFESRAYGASGDGSVVVGSSTSASGTEAFRWTAAGGMVGLGDLPAGSFYGEGKDASGDGSVVVGYSSCTASGNGAFRWTAGGGMVGLGDLPGGFFDSYAFGVSGDGSVVVGYGYGASGLEAFRWTTGGGMVALGDLPGGSFDSRANGVSGNGSVVVGRGNSASGNEAFRWTSGGGMVGLGDLPGGTFSSAATGVSDDGSVVVGYGISASGYEAFRWTSGGGMVGLGDLPGGTFVSYAWGVSGDGSIVVGRSNNASGWEAFRWTAAGRMERLWDVLVAQGVDPAADGWSRLVEARGVSDDGNTIVGYGWRNGYDEAFVAVVPEPGTWALLIGGGLAAAWFGLRRRRATLVASQNGVRVRLLVGSLMTVTLFSCWANANAALWLFDNISLTGTQEVPPNGSLASGLAQVMLDSDTREVNITGTYRNLAVVFTAAHLHGFADPGFTANVLIPLNHTGTTSGTFDGTGILADAAAVQEMLAGRTYINVHSPVYGGGEIRGQVTDPVAVPEPGTWALLIGGGLAAAWFGLRRRRQRAAGAQRSLAC